MLPIALLGTATALATPPMPKLELAPPLYTVDAAEVCFSSGLLVQAVRLPGTGTVSIATAVGGGRSAETDATRGAAHLVEHLWFRARPDGGPAIWERAEGLRIDGATYSDATVYTTVGPAADLKWLLSLEGSRLADPLAGVTEADLAAERDIVASELLWRGEHSDRAALRWLDASLWPAGHPYAASVTPIDAANALDLADARAYAKAAYKPENTSIRIEGDFEWNALQGLLEGGLPDAVRSGPRPGCARAPSKEAPPAPPASTLRKEEAPVAKPRLYVAWALPPAYGPDETKMRVAVDILADSVWQRIPWVRGVARASDIAIGCELVPGRLASEAVCTVELPLGTDPGQAWKAVQAELPNLWSPSHAEARRERIADAGAGRFVDAFADAAAQGSLEDRALSTWMGRVDPIEPMLTQLPKVDEPTVAAFAKEWFAPERAVGVALLPQPHEKSTGAAWSGQARLEAKGAPKWQVPAPATAALRAETLANGVDVWVLPRPDSVYLGLTSVVTTGGWATSPAPGTNEAFEALQRFTLPVSFDEVRRTVGVSASLDMGSMAAGRDTVGPAGNLDVALWLQRSLIDTVSLDFSARQAVLDPQVEDAFESFRSQPTSISYQLRASHVLAQDRAGRPWWDGVRAARYVAQRDVLDWQKTMYRPDNATLVVVGPVDPAQVVTTAESYLGGWKGKGAVVAAPLSALPPLPERKVFLMEAAGSDLTDVMVTCRIPPRTDENTAAFDVLDGVIERGLWQTLREDGHLYGNTYEMSFVDRRVGLLTIRTRTTPDAAVPALKGTFDLLRLVRGGVSEDVLANARMHAKGEAAWRFASADGAWWTLRTALEEGRTAKSLTASPDAVTSAQVGALLGDCFGHEAATFVGARPTGLDGLPYEDVDWAAYGAKLAESLE